MSDAANKTHRNRLGILGWAVGARWGLERYAYTLHRITGLGILAYFLLHIVVTSSIALGQGSWEWWMQLFSSWPFQIGELLVFIAFAYHALNGLRLILVELGFAVGAPEEPVYPYRSSLNTQRPLLLVVMVLAAIIIVAGGYNAFLLRPLP
jgi:succinate dehydrogenase / fumarate reductase cytochrome b subunit